MALVIDTNFMILHTKLLGELVTGASSHGFEVIIPVVVLSELDGLKQGGNYDARQAITWLHSLLSDSAPGIRVQRHAEVLDYGLRGDDAILDCCRYFRQSRFVALASNDRNLCNRVLAEEIPSVSWSQDLTASMILDEMAVRTSDVMDIDTDTNVARAPSRELIPDRVLQTSTRFASQKRNSQMPGSRHPKPPILISQRDSPSLGQLKRDARHVLITNAIQLVDFHMHLIFSKPELHHLKYKEPETERDICDLLSRERISVFGPYLRGFPLESLRLAQLGSKAEVKDYVVLWASLISRLADEFKSYKEAAQDVVRVVQNYFA